MQLLSDTCLSLLMASVSSAHLYVNTFTASATDQCSSARPRQTLDSCAHEQTQEQRCCNMTDGGNSTPRQARTELWRWQ